MLVQPFLRDVIESGEISLIWIEGEVTHGVQKKAKKDDFRVQDDHGGTVTPIDLTPELVQTAQEIMDKCIQHCEQRGWDAPLYARVDLMRDDQGKWLVSELEMVEPELWFRFCPAAADAMAKAIHGRLLGQGVTTSGRT
jgi:glutathione synthase/RimK-type ligase-like ATP-grasp enzyme